MPLYELLCIARHVDRYEHIKTLVSSAAKLVLDARGVVQTMESWGPRPLPQQIRRHGHVNRLGVYWTMHFCTNPRVLSQLNRRLKLDPMVVRWTFLKLGEKPEDLVAPQEKTRQVARVKILYNQIPHAPSEGSAPSPAPETNATAL